jgi:hypothetical protein
LEKIRKMTRPFSSCVLIGIGIAIVLLSALVGLASAAFVPLITGLSPSGGPIAGGTYVTITGFGFTGTTDVLFGGKSGTALNIVNDNQITIVTPPNSQGVVPVTLMNAAGAGSSSEPSIMFQYEETPLPKLSTISPSSGPMDGGTVVTLTGSGFTGAEYVQFGEKYGIVLNVIDDSHLTVITPASPPGSVSVSIKNAQGVGGSLEPATMYQYDFPLPELASISPSSGTIAGGTLVTITGSGFTGATDVKFGGKSATALHSINDTQLTVVTPLHSAGIVPLSVINPARFGGSLGSATMFHYEIPVPKLTSISPSFGSIEGGTVVTITGSGFNGTKLVLFGEGSATDLKIVNDSHLTIITPPHSPGSVPVSITNAHGVGESLGPDTMFRFVISPTTTTTIVKTATLAQNHSNGGEPGPAVSFPATSPAPTATTATAASGTTNTPGFEAIAGLSALAAIILLRKTKT